MQEQLEPANTRRLNKRGGQVDEGGTIFKPWLAETRVERPRRTTHNERPTNLLLMVLGRR